MPVFSSSPSPWTAFRAQVTALLADESALSTIEYSTLGGTMSGIIFLAGAAVQDATLAAVDRMTHPQ